MTRRAIGVTIATLIGIILISLIDLAGAAMAARRLAMPWRVEQWPRWNDLQLVDAPQRLASGQPLQAKVIDRNDRLPDDLLFQYKWNDDPAGEILSRPMKRTGDAAVARLDNVTQSLQYRAIGGDDDTMPWQTVEVVEPPRLESPDVKLHSPDYTRLPVEQVGQRIRALANSILSFRARTNKAVTSARLKLDSSASPLGVDVVVGDDRRSIAIVADADHPWIVDRSGTFRFELVDDEGITAESDEQWHVEMISDQPPTVSLEQPVDHIQVTTDATVPLRFVVKDDLAVKSLDLRFRRSVDPEGEITTIPLFAAETSNTNQADGLRVESRTIEYDWEMAKLTGLETGAWIEFQAVASDFKPQTAESVSRRITFVTTDELEDRIAQRQAAIINRLAEVLRVQQDARTQTRSIEIQLEETGHLTASDVDQLQSAELTQRQVTQLLTNPTDGVRAMIALLLADLDNNRIDSPEVRRRMNELAEAIAMIADQHLPTISGGLTTTLKSARTALQSNEAATVGRSAVADPLEPVGREQDEVISVLERLLGDLSQWDSYRRFAREVSRMRRDQQLIHDRTNQLRLNALSRPGGDLEPAQKAELRRLVEQQSELARRLDRMLSRMEQMRGQLESSDPLAAATLGDAVESARRTAVSGQMHESSRNLEAGRIGQAASQQEEVDQHLGELLDTLSNRRENELDRAIRQMDQASRELDSLRRRQTSAREQMDAAQANPGEQAKRRELERLTREQRALAEETERLARRLERLNAQRSSQSLQRAAEQMQNSGAAAEQGDSQSAADSARQAERDLEEAQQQLARETQQAKQDLLNEQLARLEHAVDGLIIRQKSVVDETRRLEGLRDSEGTLTRAQAASVQLLAKEQRMLADEVEQLARQLEQAEAFAMGLDGAVREMHRAASRLDRDDTGTATLESERIALARLEQVQEALKDDPATQPPQPPDGQGNGENGGNSPTADTIRALSELKLIKLMQIEINRRTTELERQRGRDGQLDDERLRESQDLADEQGRLAELVSRLVQAAAPNPDDSPESLPDLDDLLPKDEK